MTSITDPARSLPAQAPGGLRARTVAYLQLGKARLYQHHYGWVIGVALLLTGTAPLPPGAALSLALTFVMILGVQWSSCAADDVAGQLDGHDTINYAGRPAWTVARKPLVTGALTMRQANRFVVVGWVAGLVFGLLGAAATGWSSGWAGVAIVVGGSVLATQYTRGLRLSYRPLGADAVMFTVIACTALIPYWLAAGSPSREILLVAAVIGWWFMSFASYGHASDRVGDATVGRRTLAVVLGPWGYGAAQHVMMAVNITLVTLLFTTTRLDPVLVLLVVPALLLQVVQLCYGAYARKLRVARLLGVIATDVGCLGILAAVLLS